MSRTITIVGASARAAAFSAARAGLTVCAADLFADADLRRLCDAEQVRRYPAGLASAVRGPQTGGWMFTGALENHPALVDELALLRPLWGNRGDVLRRVRQPQLVARALQRSKLPCPAVAFNPAELDRAQDWLLKPLRSAGGAHVSRYEKTLSKDVRSRGCYIQQYIEGLACSAVFVAARGRAVLLGITRQLIGEGWTGGGGFQYCGSVGPVELGNHTTDAWAQLGSVLAGEFGLAGLFGVDAVVNAAGVWPVEVNPRYTASVEVLERSHGIRAVDMHIAACESGELPARVAAPGALRCGKAIVFARRPFVVPSTWESLMAERCRSDWPAWADVPRAGSTIEAGWPILTVFAAAVGEREVLEMLKRSAAETLAAHLR